MPEPVVSTEIASAHYLLGPVNEIKKKTKFENISLKQERAFLARSLTMTFNYEINRNIRLNHATCGFQMQCQTE